MPLEFPRNQSAVLGRYVSRSLRLARLALMILIVSASPDPLIVSASISTRSALRLSQSKEASFVFRVVQIRTVEGVRIGEHSGGLIKRHAMLTQVRGGLACVPLDHWYLVYT